jgi:SMODS-associated and fused to various effectors sensor domain
MQYKPGRADLRAFPDTPYLHDAVVHIFAACPNSLLFFLGQHHQGISPCIIYEFDFDRRATKPISRPSLWIEPEPQRIQRAQSVTRLFYRPALARGSTALNSESPNAI